MVTTGDTNHSSSLRYFIPYYYRTVKLYDLGVWSKSFHYAVQQGYRGTGMDSFYLWSIFYGEEEEEENM